MRANPRSKSGRTKGQGQAAPDAASATPPVDPNAVKGERARRAARTPERDRVLITGALRQLKRTTGTGLAAPTLPPESDPQAAHPIIAAANAQRELATRTAELKAWAGPDEELHPWEQQPHENDADFASFLTYLNLGPGRSVRQAAIDHHAGAVRGLNPDYPHLPPPRWGALSARWGWPERADRWDAFVANQHLEKTRERMLTDREKRYVRREEAREKLYELISAMDPNLVELRPGDLFRAVSILNDDARQDLDRIVEKADSARDANPLDLQGAAMTFAMMNELANKAKAAPVVVAREPRASRDEDEDGTTMEGEFRNIS